MLHTFIICSQVYSCAVFYANIDLISSFDCILMKLYSFFSLSEGYDMSTFIRRYAKYLNEKAVSYRQMAFDFCKVKRG